MTERGAPQPAPEPPPLHPAVRNTMVGCLTFVVGFFGGGMIAVLLAKGVDMARRCTPGEGLPACGWQYYMLIGGLVGAIFLPAMVLMKLRRGSAAMRNTAQ